MSETLKQVDIFTDGACSGNPGPGGWAAILRYGPHEMEISGSMPQTTNNRMELMGVIAGLEALNKPCVVKVITDSQYVVKAFNEHWIEGWLKTNWKKGTVKNIELWERLLKAKEPHEVTFEWVKGHAGHPENERCDKLATQSADSVE